uniref:Uncharacterized protein n=1 Tax=Streptomyces olivaceus TaxID=47716 RepID=A0A2R3ZQ10_STROV|nr:hypothetical protein [Streptomyces olivaceus]
MRGYGYRRNAGSGHFRGTFVPVAAPHAAVAAEQGAESAGDGREAVRQRGAPIRPPDRYVCVTARPRTEFAPSALRGLV